MVPGSVIVFLDSFSPSLLTCTFSGSGLAKTHFHQHSIETSVLPDSPLGIARFHRILKTMTTPSNIGRIPANLGLAAGGSGKADEWANLIRILMPALGYVLWYQDPSEEEKVELEDEWRARTKKVALDRGKVAKASSKSGSKKRKVDDNGSADLDNAASQLPQDSSSTLQDSLPRKGGKAPRKGFKDFWTDKMKDLDLKDPAAALEIRRKSFENMLLLSAALRIISSHEITPAEADFSRDLLSEYCRGVVSIFGPAAINPNHHLSSSHFTPNTHDYSCENNWNTFPTERLNGVLKKVPTNGKESEKEKTMMTAYNDIVALDGVRLYGTASGSLTPEAVALLDKVSEVFKDDRGSLNTDFSMAEFLDQQLQKRLNLDYVLHPNSKSRAFSEEVYQGLVKFWKGQVFLGSYKVVPQGTFVKVSDRPATIVVPGTALFSTSAVIHGLLYATKPTEAHDDSIALCKYTNVDGTARFRPARIRHFFHQELKLGPGFYSQDFVVVQWYNEAPPNVDRPFAGFKAVEYLGQHLVSKTLAPINHQSFLDLTFVGSKLTCLPGIEIDGESYLLCTDSGKTKSGASHYCSFASLISLLFTGFEIDN